MSNDAPPPYVPLPGLWFGEPAMTATPSRLPTLARVTSPNREWYTALCGGTFGEQTLTIVGGLGRNLVLTSTDGESFTTKIASGGRGLRAIVRDGDTTWLAGEYGTLFKCPADLSSLEQVQTGSGSCLHGGARTSDGAIWIGGDGGFLLRSIGGGPFERITGIPGTVQKMLATPDGLFVPTSEGLFFLRDNRADYPEKLWSEPVNQVLVTRAKTTVAVANKNTILRAPAGTTAFVKATVPPFAVTDVPASVKFDRPSWIPPSQDLNVMADLSDGRIVVGGDGGTILFSSDDGVTFERVPHQLTAGSFWCVATFKGNVFLGGENNIVVRAS